MPSGRRSGGSHRSGGFSRSSSSRSGSSVGRRSSLHSSSISHSSRPHHYHRSRTSIYIGGSPWHRGTSSYDDGQDYSSVDQAMEALTPEGQEHLKQIRKYEGKKTIATVLLFFAIPAIIFTFVMFVSGAFMTVRTIKKDYEYYHQMIATAEANEKLIVDGHFKRATKILDSDVDKYYIEYYFYTEDDGGTKVDGETYSVYDTATALSYEEGDIIKLAVDEYPTSYWTDSIPMDFKNYDYKDDGEYPIAKRTSNIFTVIFVLCGSAIVAGVVINAIYSKKIEALAKDLYKYRKAKSGSANATTKKCRYCGSELKNGENSCANCGASDASE